MRNTQCLAAGRTEIDIAFSEDTSAEFAVRDVVNVPIAMRALRQNLSFQFEFEFVHSVYLPTSASDEHQPFILHLVERLVSAKSGRCKII